MKLFCYQPSGHGQLSFYVIAENEAEAYQKVQEKVNALRAEGHHYDCDGWGTDYYELIIADIGEVLTNAND